MSSWQVPAGGSGSAGFTNTGLGYNGTNLLIGDFTNGRIVEVTTAGAYVGEIVLSGSPASSVQGVAYDSSDGTYWVCHYAATNGTIKNYDSSGTLLNTISPTIGNPGPNGCCYDAANDRILAIWPNNVIRGYDCVDKSLDETITLSGITGTAADGIALDPSSPSTILWVTLDGTAEAAPCYLEKITRSTGASTAAVVVPSSIESIVYVGSDLYSCNDQNYHLSVTNGNRVWSLDPTTGIEVQASAFQVASGSFDLSTSSATQILTGVGFAPKVILFFGFNNSAGSTQATSFGVADWACRQWAQSIRSTDAVNPSNDERSWSSTRCIETTSGGGVYDGRAVFASVTHDGAALVVTAAGNARRIHWVALAGDDVDAKAGYFDLSTSSGTQAVTGVGFQPTAVLMSASTSSTTEGVATTESRFSLGAMTAAAQWVMATVGTDNVTPTAEHSVGRTDAVLVRVSGTSSPTMLAAYSSLDSDGFTVNKSTAPGATLRCGYIAFGGAAEYAIGAFNQPTSTGNQAITGVGFQPEALLFASAGKVASTTATVHGVTMIGAALSTSNRRAHQSSAESGVATSNTARDTSEAAAIIASSAGGTPTRLATADFVSHDSDGFTLNWSTADAVARELFYLAVSAGVVSLDLTETTDVALSGSISVSGDLQIGTNFNLTQAAAVGLAGSVGVSGDIQILSGSLDLAQTSAVAMSGTVGLSGDLQIGTDFNLTQSVALAMSGSVAVAGDFQSGTAPVVTQAYGNFGWDPRIRPSWKRKELREELEAALDDAPKAVQELVRVPGPDINEVPVREALEVVRTARKHRERAVTRQELDELHEALETVATFTREREAARQARRRKQQHLLLLS